MPRATTTAITTRSSTAASTPTTIAGTLADVAMYYYERDLHPSLSNGVPTTARDTSGAPAAAFSGNGELMHQHMKTFTSRWVSKGLINQSSDSGELHAAVCVGRSVQRRSREDRRHVARGGQRPRSVPAGERPGLLSQALQSAFQEFSNGSVSVSAVAFNSTALREQTVEYRGFFNLKYNTGDLRALECRRDDRRRRRRDIRSGALRRCSIRRPRTTGSSSRTTASAMRDFRSASRNLNANQKLILDSNELNWIARRSQPQEEPLGSFRARPAVRRSARRHRALGAAVRRRSARDPSRPAAVPDDQSVLGVQGRAGEHASRWCTSRRTTG